MDQSKLVELLSILSDDEKTQLLQFAEIPAFNHGRMRSQTGSLLFYLVQNLTSQPLEKEKVFSKIFPGQKFDESKLEKVMVDAHKLVRDFLLVQHYFREKNEFNIWHDYSKILRSRGMTVRHKAVLKKLGKIQSETKCKDEVYFYQQFMLEYTQHEYDTLHSLTKGDLNISNALNALEAHYHASRLSLINRLLVLKFISKVDISSYIPELFTQIPIPDKFVSSSPIIRISSEIFYLLINPNPTPTDVGHLLNIIRYHEPDLNREYLNIYYVYLRNVCIRISNIQFDNEDIRHTLFDLYKDNFARGFLHYEGKLSPNTYLAVTVSAIRVKQFDWAYTFIESNKNDILGENDERDLYRLNLAIYLFAIGKFEECLDSIPPNSPIIDYLMHGKRLELKALYELQSDLLTYRMDNFKMFMSRTSPKILSESTRLHNQNFANFLTQLIASIPGDVKRSEQIAQRLMQKKQTADWLWLLEKAKAIARTH